MRVRVYVCVCLTVVVHSARSERLPLCLPYVRIYFVRYDEFGLGRVLAFILELSTGVARP